MGIINFSHDWQKSIDEGRTGHTKSKVTYVMNWLHSTYVASLSLLIETSGMNQAGARPCTALMD